MYSEGTGMNGRSIPPALVEKRRIEALWQHAIGRGALIALHKPAWRPGERIELGVEGCVVMEDYGFITVRYYGAAPLRNTKQGLGYPGKLHSWAPRQARKALRRDLMTQGAGL